MARVAIDLFESDTSPSMSSWHLPTLKKREEKRREEAVEREMEGGREIDSERERERVRGRERKEEGGGGMGRNGMG